MSEMKILIIRNYPSYFSLNRNTYNIQEIGLAKSLVKKGYKCDIVFWTNKQEKTIDYSLLGNKKIRIYYRKGISFLKNTILKIGDLIDNYDIIQTCEYNQIQSWLLANRYPEKTVIYHGPYYSDFNKNYNKMCKVFDFFFLPKYKKKNIHFIVKSKLAKDFLKNKGINNVIDLGVGVDIELFELNSKNCTEEIYKEIDSFYGIKLLYIGKLEKRRNIEFLIRILKKINQYSNAKLFLIGDGDKKYIESIFLMARSLEIDTKIYWLKSIEQKKISPIYAKVDYFLLPTHYEIFGMVLLEAMYFQKVVLTTFNGGSSMLIENGKNGFIFSEKQENKWVEIILKLEKNKTLKNKIGKSAHDTIVNYFTWDRLADSFIEAYKRRIAKNENTND